MQAIRTEHSITLVSLSFHLSFTAESSVSHNPITEVNLKLSIEHQWLRPRRTASRHCLFTCLTCCCSRCSCLLHLTQSLVRVHVMQQYKVCILSLQDH